MLRFWTTVFTICLTINRKAVLSLTETATPSLKMFAPSAAGKQVITYDVAGHKTEVANYSGDGCKRASEVYEYDSAGDMVEWKSYDGAGNITWRRTYKYDSMGNE